MSTSSTIEKVSGSLPSTCACCKRVVACNYKFENQLYCSESCVKEQIVLINQVSTLCSVTGLNPSEIKKAMSVNNWSLDDFTQNIDSYLDAISSGASIPAATTTAFQNAGVYNTLGKNLASYNTMRGGANFKGFVFEELHAAKTTISGTPTTVLSNNGLADFIIVQPNGKRVLGQAKAGYQNTYIDFQKYKGQTIVVDKGNAQLMQRAKNAGLNVVESEVSLKQSKGLADIMKLESQILRTANAPLTSKIYALNQAGIASAKTGGAAGAGFSIGSNIVEVFSGDKEWSEAGVAVARDTAIATASSYVIGVAANTAVGSAVTGAVTGVVSSAGTALAGTAVGSSVVAGAGAVTGAVTAATTAVTGAVASSAVGVGVASAATAVTTAATGVGTALAGTAVGTAVTGAATAVAGTAVGGAAIAGAAAVGAAAVAAAPVVAVAAVAGGVFALGKKLFGR